MMLTLQCYTLKLSITKVPHCSLLIHSRTPLHTIKKRYAKPPPTSPAKALIPGQVVSLAGPCSYIIKTSAGHIRLNRTQIKKSPPVNTHTFPPSPQPTLLDATVPNHLTAQTPTPDTLPCPMPNLPEPVTSTNMKPCQIPPSEPNPPPQDLQPCSPASPARQTVTRSSRVFRCPPAIQINCAQTEIECFTDIHYYICLLQKTFI